MTYPPQADVKAGVGRALASGGPIEWPVHGFRHAAEGDTSGWYLWTGELGDGDDFFVPLHPRHLADRAPEVLTELAAPPGTRFLLAPDHRDVWFDATLLNQR